MTKSQQIHHGARPDRGGRRRRRGPGRLAAVLVAMALLAVACGDDDGGGDDAASPSTTAPGPTTATSGGDTGGDDTGGDDTSGPPEDADPEGVLRIATNFNIAGGYNIDPAKGASISYDAISYLLLGTPLFLDRDGEIKPYLAEGWEIPDATTFVLKLREGLTFQDGQPYDAQTLKDTYEAKLASSETAFLGGPWRQIDTMTVDSPTQLTFKMKTPSAGMMPSILTQTFGHAAAPGYDPAMPVGAGPYKVVHYQDRTLLRLEKWDGFFRADDFYLKTIEFIEVPGGAATLNALRADQVDLVSSSPNQLQETAASGDFGIVVTNNEAHYHFVQCLTAPPFDNPLFREAFYLAINQEEMNAGVMGGNAEPMESLWPSGHRFNVPGLINPEGDIERARQIVEENGFAGTRVRIGMYNVPTQQRIAEVLQAQVAEVGIEAELIPFPPGQLPNSTITPDSGGGYVVANTFPGITKVTQSALLAAPGPSSMCPEAPDAHPDLRADADAIVAGDLTDDELEERWRNLQTNIMRQFLDMPMLTQPAAYLYNKRVAGLQPGTVGLTAATAPGPFLEGVYIKRD